MLGVLGCRVMPAEMRSSLGGRLQNSGKSGNKRGLMLRKTELVSAVAAKTDLTKERAGRVLNAILDEITAAMERNDTVSLVGFGSFSQRHRGARVGKNPQTGEPINISASNTVAFKAGKQLKDAVNS